MRVCGSAKGRPGRESGRQQVDRLPTFVAVGALSLLAAVAGVATSGVLSPAAAQAPLDPFGLHCVAQRLESNDWLRVCAGIVDSGERGPFAAPIQAYATAAVYTKRDSRVVLQPRTGAALRNLELYQDHQLVSSGFPPPWFLPEAVDDGFVSVLGTPSSLPAGYVQAHVTGYAVSRVGGQERTALTDVWSFPVRLDDLVALPPAS